MSCHHSARAIDLHHKQVDNARERKALRQQNRLAAFLTRRAEIRAEVTYWQVAVFVFTFIAVMGYVGITYANLWYLFR